MHRHFPMQLHHTSRGPAPASTVPKLWNNGAKSPSGAGRSWPNWKGGRALSSAPFPVATATSPWCRPPSEAWAPPSVTISRLTSGHELAAPWPFFHFNQPIQPLVCSFILMLPAPSLHCHSAATPNHGVDPSLALGLKTCESQSSGRRHFSWAIATVHQWFDAYHPCAGGKCPTSETCYTSRFEKECSRVVRASRATTVSIHSKLWSHDLKGLCHVCRNIMFPTWLRLAVARVPQ